MKYPLLYTLRAIAAVAWIVSRTAEAQVKTDLDGKTFSGGRRVGKNGNTVLLKGRCDPTCNGVGQSRITLSQKRLVKANKRTFFMIDHCTMPAFPQRIN